jgi:hypothetical protein
MRSACGIERSTTAHVAGSQQGIGPTRIAMEHRRAGGTRGLYLLLVCLQQQMRHAGVAKNL